MGAQDSFLAYDTDGIIVVQTSDLKYVGLHEMRISASLVDYPSVTTSLVTTLPLEFNPCPIGIEQWSLSDVSVAPLEPAAQLFSQPEFTYKVAADCGFTWKSF